MTDKPEIVVTPEPLPPTPPRVRPEMWGWVGWHESRCGWTGAACYTIREVADSRARAKGIEDAEVFRIPASDAPAADAIPAVVPVVLGDPPPSQSFWSLWSSLLELALKDEKKEVADLRKRLEEAEANLKEVLRQKSKMRMTMEDAETKLADETNLRIEAETGKAMAEAALADAERWLK